MEIRKMIIWFKNKLLRLSLDCFQIRKKGQHLDQKKII